MKHTTKYDDVWVLLDTYHSVVSVCKSKANAKRQLRLLARFEAENRSTKIMEEQDTRIVFENYDWVDMICVPQRNTLQSFSKTMGFGYLLNK